MYCKNCGKELSKDSKFCSECGTKVEIEPVKPAATEPMFFAKELAEATAAIAAKEKPRKVVHLEEFQWDLDGYPTAPKKTEAVDFNWASVVEEKRRVTNPKPSFVDDVVDETKEEIGQNLEEEFYPEDLPLVTVEDLLASLPDQPEFNWSLEIPHAEILSEETAEKVEEAAEETEESTAEVVCEEPVEELVEETMEAVEEEDEISLEEDLLEDFQAQPIAEPTRLIEKAQIIPEIEGMDKFYTFNNKQAELQALLDQEYERLKQDHLEHESFAFGEDKSSLFGLFDETEEEELEEEDEIAVEEVEVAEMEVEAAEEKAEEIPVMEEPSVEPQEPAPLELVTVVWASTPESVVVEPEIEVVAEPETEVTVEETEEPAAEEKSEETEIPVEEPKKATITEDNHSPSKGGDENHKLTFHDVFGDDDDDEEKEKGGCLKTIAILLCILVVIELGILGVQYFIPDSKVGQLIDKGYQYVTELIFGADEEVDPVVDETATPSEIEIIIGEQMIKNQNVESITEDRNLMFETEDVYGYDELASTYAFQNSPWFETEDGQTVTFGDEIIGTLIQYYSGLCDKMNGVNDDVLEYIDLSSDLYQDTFAIEGSEETAFVIKSLEIGEIRTGSEGFYILTKVTIQNQDSPDGASETHAIYLKPDANKKEMDLVEIHKN